MRNRTGDSVEQRQVPRWATLSAWAAFLVTVPSAVWRVLMITGLMPGTAALREFELAGDHTAGYVYVFTLSIVQLGAAFLTVGLVREWGAVFCGRRIPVTPVVAVATLGGIAVTYLFSVSMVTQVLAGHRPDAGNVHGIALAVMVGCYVPIVLWGPLELVTTYGYWRRATSSSQKPWVSAGADRVSEGVAER